MKISVCYRDLEGGFITKDDYEEAIQLLINAKDQLKPDGNHCLVCGDNGHQAWECRHNPLVMARRATRKEETFKCFHCGELFDFNTAEEHFGKRDEKEYPICVR